MTNDTCQRIFEFIVQHKKDNDGLSPKYREMADKLSLGSTSVVGRHLKDLEAQGLIELVSSDKRSATGIKVTGGFWDYNTEHLSEVYDTIT